MVAEASISYDTLNLSMEVKWPADLLSAEGWRAGLAREMPQIAGQTRDFWMSRAGQALKSSRRDARDSLFQFCKQNCRNTRG